MNHLGGVHGPSAVSVKGVRGQVEAQGPHLPHPAQVPSYRGVPAVPAQGMRLVSATEGQGRWPLNPGLLGSQIIHVGRKRQLGLFVAALPFEAPLPALQALGTGLYHTSRTREGQNRRHLHQTAVVVAEVPGAGAAPARRDLALDLG